MEFELSYTAVQEQFRNEVRAWLVENVPDGVNSKRRNRGRKLAGNGGSHGQRKITVLAVRFAVRDRKSVV